MLNIKIDIAQGGIPITSKILQKFNATTKEHKIKLKSDMRH